MNGKLYKVVVGNKIINNFDDALHVFSPVNGVEMVGSIPKVSTEGQVRKIFSDAKNAFYIYRNVDFIQRKKWLLNFANLLKENCDELSNLIVLEVAKNKTEAINEVDRSIKYIKDTIEEYERIINNPLIIDEKQHNIQGKIGKFSYEPLGVVLAISPFNYPLNLLISKLAPALISGNVVVYKPATQGSCVGAFVSTLLYEAGFKNGEVSCIIGKGSEIGDFIINDKNIDVISFTGSTKIGKQIAKNNPLIPVVLEMGGKDAAIVLKDADLIKTAKRIVDGAFAYNGQRCTCIKRVLVDKKVEAQLIELIDKEISKLTVGSALSTNSNITEMIDIQSLKYNLQLLLDAYKKGSKTNQPIKRKGNILWPVALYNVSLDSKIANEEQFGPILPIISFDSIEEAIEICNDSEFGLQASIFSQNIDQAKRIASLLEVGTVNINRAPSRGPDVFPFLGIKNSGKGIQGIKDSIISMNRLKGIIENEG